MKTDPVHILGCIKAPGRRCCGAEILAKIESAFLGSDEVTGVSRTVCPEPCVDIYTDILNEALASEQLAVSTIASSVHASTLTAKCVYFCIVTIVICE